MPDWLAVIILGVIEGITEFLPVSSTGHLLLAEHWLPRQSDLFNVVIQSGAVLAVIPLFPHRWRQMRQWRRDPQARDFLLKVLLAFGLTGAGGVVLEGLGFALPEEILPVAVALVLGGVAFLVAEWWLRQRPVKTEVTWGIAVAVALVLGGVAFLVAEWWLRQRPVKTEVTWGIAVAVGLGQLLAAVFPGTSRSGATIVLMLALGLSRVAATEFAFLVGIPTMLAAGGLKIFKGVVAPAICPDAHLQRVRVVPHRARGRAAVVPVGAAPTERRWARETIGPTADRAGQISVTPETGVRRASDSGHPARATRRGALARPRGRRRARQSRRRSGWSRGGEQC